MKVQRLVSESMQSGGTFKRGQPGFLNFTPDQIQTQSYVPRGAWFKSSDGTLYQRRQDGGYSKYLNFQPDGVDMKSILTIPKSVERSILPFVDQSIDGENGFGGFIGPQLIPSAVGGIDIGSITGNPSANPMSAAGATPQGQTANPFDPGMDLFKGQNINVTSQPHPLSVNQNAPSPTPRRPQSFMQYAGQTINKAGKFFKDLFS